MRRSQERSVQVVGPPMERALDVSRVRGLGDERRLAMSADVVEDLHAAGAPNHEESLAVHRDRALVSDLGDHPLVPHVDGALPEQGRALPVEERGVEVPRSLKQCIHAPLQGDKRKRRKREESNLDVLPPPVFEAGRPSHGHPFQVAGAAAGQSVAPEGPWRHLEPYVALPLQRRKKEDSNLDVLPPSVFQTDCPPWALLPSVRAEGLEPPTIAV